MSQVENLKCAQRAAALQGLGGGEVEERWLELGKGGGGWVLFLPWRSLRRKEVSIGLGWGSGRRGHAVVPRGPSEQQQGGGDLPQRLSGLGLQAPPSWLALQRPGLLPTPLLPPSSALPTSRHSWHENFCLVPLAFCLSHLPLSHLFSGPALGLFARPQHGPWEPWSFVVLTSVSSCRRLLQQ